MPIKLCSECARGNHGQCTGLSVDHFEDDRPYPCPCYRCNPPKPSLCTACGRPVNPMTGECAGCSD